ncbi:hypothetical protein JCM16303_004899 [Sporobolomyces ruberrimus]
MTPTRASGSGTHHRVQPSTASTSSSFGYSFDPSLSTRHYTPYSCDQGPRELDYNGEAEEEEGEYATRREEPSSRNGRGKIKRNDSIFSFEGVTNDQKQERNLDRREEDEGAFQGEEYLNHSFNTRGGSGTGGTGGGRRNKRYGLSHEGDDGIGGGTVGDYSASDSSEEEEDLEVFDLNDHRTVSGGGTSSSTMTSTTTGTTSRRTHTRFEALTGQELGWMGVSSVCVLGLTVGAIVVAIVG